MQRRAYRRYRKWMRAFGTPASASAIAATPIGTTAGGRTTTAAAVRSRVAKASGTTTAAFYAAAAPGCRGERAGRGCGLPAGRAQVDPGAGHPLFLHDEPRVAHGHAALALVLGDLE